MEYKPTSEFTNQEKEMMDTIAVNYILAQSDGLQKGYSQALTDFTDAMIDYWKGTDDEPQQSILAILVDLGVELGKLRKIAERNAEEAKKRGYDKYYLWEYKTEDEPFGRNIQLFTKKPQSKSEMEK